MSYKTEFKTTPMEGRTAWCYLGQPRLEDMNGKKFEQPRYECAFYFPKTAADPRQCRNYAFFAQMALEVVQNAYRGQWPMIGAGGAWTDWPIDDCDVPAIADKYPWARGMWRVSLSAGKYRPRLFDAGNNLVTPDVDGKYRQSVFKGDDGIGGDWAMASVNAYAWEYGASRKGVSFGVEGIKVTRQDEQTGGGGRSGEAMFGAPTGQPVFGGAPPQPPSGVPYGSYGAPPAPPQQQYGAPPAPPQQQYGAPPQQQYGAPPAPPQQQYGAPPAPPQQQYGAPPAPPQQQYGAPPSAPQPGGYPPGPPQPGPYANTAATPSGVPGATQNPPVGYATTAYPSSGAPLPGPGAPPPPPAQGYAPQGGYSQPQIGQR